MESIAQKPKDNSNGEQGQMLDIQVESFINYQELIDKNEEPLDDEKSAENYEITEQEIESLTSILNENEV